MSFEKVDNKSSPLESTDGHSLDSPQEDIYKIHASVEGISGKMVVWFMDLKANKASEKEIISKPGMFTFHTPIGNKSGYSIVIEENPTGQTSTISKDVGFIDGSDVNDIKIHCTDLPQMGITFLDTNYVKDYARGNIHITRKPNENDVMSYVLSWGAGGFNFKCGTITEIKKTGSNLNFHLNNSYLYWQFRRHIILESKGYDGKITGRAITASKDRYDGFGSVCHHSSHIDTVFSKEESFTNWFGNCAVKPLEIDYPENLEDIIALVQRASSSKRRIRMTGSGLSISDIMITKDILLFPNELEGQLPPITT